MNRINTCFDQIKKNDKKALIPFITAGDPSSNLTVSIMHELVRSGSAGSLMVIITNHRHQYSWKYKSESCTQT